MSKFYLVKSPELIDKINDWALIRVQTHNKILNLSRRYGGSRNRIGTSETWGVRSFGFVFNKEPDKKIWKKEHKGSKFWIPKYSSEIGKKIREEIKEILKDGGNIIEVGNFIGLKDAFCVVGIRLILGNIYIVVGDDWNFNKDGLERVSDIFIEEQEDLEKNKGKK